MNLDRWRAILLTSRPVVAALLVILVAAMIGWLWLMFVVLHVGATLGIGS